MPFLGTEKGNFLKYHGIQAKRVTFLPPARVSLNEETRNLLACSKMILLVLVMAVVPKVRLSLPMAIRKRLVQMQKVPYN
jgi:hypothetical protein